MKRPNEFPDREDDARQHKPSVAKEEKPLSAPTLGYVYLPHSDIGILMDTALLLLENLFRLPLVRRRRRKYTKSTKT
jgi:hypothetical protein